MELEFNNVKKEPYRFADVVEIFCAFENNKHCSKTDAGSLIKNETRDPDDLLDVDEEDRDDDGFDDNLGSDEKNDTIEEWVEDCFLHLEYREKTFGDDYPFSIDNDKLSLKNKVTDWHKFYLFLLVASRNKTFKEQGFPQKTADFFELLSKDSLKNLMNEKAVVCMFGPNSKDRKKIFGSNLQNALPELVKFMGMELSPGWSKNLKTQGDAGIDLVGVQNLDVGVQNLDVGVQNLDLGAFGQNVYIAQCAAREDPIHWERKRCEVDMDYKKKYFCFLVKPQSVLFIPSCYRDLSGKWVDKNYVSNVILMDRVRIMNTLRSLPGCQLESRGDITNFVNDLLKT